MTKRRLYLIPARAGSKGLPGKNVKILGDKSLVAYSIKFAQECMTEGDALCVSTNDVDVLNVCNELQVTPPFVRPDELAGDTSSTADVIIHAIEFYRSRGEEFEEIVLLQPTSPFRSKTDMDAMIGIMDEKACDMVVSVKEVKDNPYFNLFIEGEEGMLQSFIQENQRVSRRQDAPTAYAYNGSIYLFNRSEFERLKGLAFGRIIKYVMPDSRSVDIDTPLDWNIAEFFLNRLDENN